MNSNEAIQNFEKISMVLDKCANKPQNYNTQWSYYLEQMSYSLNQQANDLRMLQELLDF